jgi:hypothetical protein
MNDFEFVGRSTAHETPDYSFVLDEYRRPDGAQFLLAHLTFSRFTPSVFKKLLCEWRTFRERVTAPLFACPEHDDGKWHRFVTRTGWKYLLHIKCNNGEIRPLYIHRTTCP